MTDREAAEQALREAGFERLSDDYEGGGVWWRRTLGLLCDEVCLPMAVEDNWVGLHINTTLSALPSFIRSGYTKEQIEKAVKEVLREKGWAARYDYGHHALGEKVPTQLLVEAIAAHLTAADGKTPSE